MWQWVVSKWNAIGDGIGASVSAVGGFIGRWSATCASRCSAATEVFNWVSASSRPSSTSSPGSSAAIARVAGSIADAIKKPINAVIGMWNRMEFRIPDFTLPSFDIGPVHLGGQHFGGATIGFPDIPTLAGGGVLTSPTLFLGGEAGTEIVAPEDDAARHRRGGRRRALHAQHLPAHRGQLRHRVRVPPPRADGGF